MARTPPESRPPGTRPLAERDPAHAAIRPLLASAMAELNAGQAAAAQILCRKALVQQPGDAIALFALANACIGAADFRAAYGPARRAWRLDPHNHRYAMAYGRLALGLNDLVAVKGLLDGIDHERAAADAEFHKLNARALLALGDPVGAIAAFNRRLEMVPNDAQAHLYRGVAYQMSGDLAGAIAGHRRAAELDPRDTAITSNLIVLRDFDPASTMADLAAARRDWQRRHGAPPEAIAPHANDRNPERPLRIGYVSSYFHHSSGAEILIGIIENHDPALYRAICYSSGSKADGMTSRFRARSDWVDAQGLDDAALAARIRRDAVDILIDPDGHSPHNRLTLFTRRPAPIQATGWGHAGGTGLAAMDYAFVDPVFAPPGDQIHYAERLCDLPCVLTMRPPADAPPVALPGAAERNGFVTFGCLNRLTKVSPSVLGVWSRILHAVPHSRLLLKGRLLDDPPLRRTITQVMEGHGIGTDRLRLVGGTTRAEHLAAHADVDIALDPFPMSGGVSTIEALWMGVPVITLRGATMLGRATAAVLTALGEPQLVADGGDDYVARAVALAADGAALKRYRETLRARAAASPITNVALYTRAVEQAYRSIWRAWCAEPDAA